MKIMKKKIKKTKQLPVIFGLKTIKFDRGFQKPIGTDQDQTSSIKTSYNKGIHTVVIT